MSPMCFWTSLIFSTVFASSSSSISMRSVSLSILATFFSIFHAMSFWVDSIFWYSSLHWSRFCLSSASSSFSTCIMLSMAVSTLSKWPTLVVLTSAAKRARRRLWDLVALLLSAAKALFSGTDASAELEVCRSMVSLPGLMALLNSSRASSLVRISRALLMPRISSSRRDLRVPHSVALLSQDSLVTSKKSTSAFICASVSSYSCVDSASIISASALAFSAAFRVSWSSLSVSCFAAMKASKSRFLVASPSLAVSRSSVKVAYMSVRMPVMVADCGEYLPFALDMLVRSPSLAFDSFARAEAGAAAMTALMCCATSSALPCSREEPEVAAPRTVTAFSREAIACCISEISAW
mmetsp:Transcript_69357/g.181775  ORF Transcript_69357/g.181775 Transcript_69357/m.181775 type:complete len:352 (-) Transcript_69357:242-1297(-)